MKDITEIEYSLAWDLKMVMEEEKMNIESLAKETGISKATIYSVLKGEKTIDSVYEKFYSFAFSRSYRINKVKEEFLKETNQTILFHGSKQGLTQIDSQGGRKNCDFGSGFYLGESYENALSFVCENEKSVVYSFALDLTGLQTVHFDCDLDWMLSICHYRGMLKEFDKTEKIKEIIAKSEACDLIIAPIADNRMFYIMSLFVNGDINCEMALHSLSASQLGKQYVIKTDKALSQLHPLEKYYLCDEEKREFLLKMNQRAMEIDTKLKMAKREFVNGQYIEEILK